MYAEAAAQLIKMTSEVHYWLILDRDCLVFMDQSVVTPVPLWLGDVVVRLFRLLASAFLGSLGQLVFHPSLVGKSSTRILDRVKAGHIQLCRVASNTVWSHMAGDAPMSVMGLVSLRAVRFCNLLTFMLHWVTCYKHMYVFGPIP